ncbi:MAG: DUF202 domain-containing protein [Reichenbachiella sp.]|uniref:DUF202 domain-containing protein n=1 Tax=Reichenbachiella sp. TaxID=2184521 RepID=UPI0032987566
MILRDYLAVDRTKLANLRTLLAFVRTSLYLVVSGLAILKVKELYQLIPIAYLLIGSSLIALAAGLTSYFRFRRKIGTQYKDKLS